MQVGYIITGVTAIPTFILAYVAFRRQRVNPTENGTDFIAAQWEKWYNMSVAQTETERKMRYRAEERVDELEEQIRRLEGGEP